MAVWVLWLQPRQLDVHDQGYFKDFVKVTIANFIRRTFMVL